MTSHDACTSMSSRILTVASLQRLKMAALIRTPADCEVRSVIKFLNAQSIAPIEIHRQLYHIRLDDLAPSDFRLFLHLKKFLVRSASAFSEWQRWVSQWLQSQAADFYNTRYKSWSHGMTNASIPEVNMLKNSSTLAVSVSINLSIKLGFVSVNGPRETYFVDALRT